MKRIILMLLGLIFLSTGYAKRVSQQEAYEIASQFMDGKNIKTKPRLVKGEKNSPVFNNYYLYNFEDNGGFVIVSGDDRTPSILGYADNGNIDINDIPINMKWLLDIYDAQIASLSETSSVSSKIRSEERAEIPALIDVQWGQGEPYNNNCPTLNGERCLTGCVATAMAQLVYYHKWPQEKIPYIDGFKTRTNSIQVEDLPETEFDWSNMAESDIATLMRYCGQSVHMDYDPIESGASIHEIPSALMDIFDFSSSIAVKSRYNYSDDKWLDMIYNDIYNGNPLLYFGQSLSNEGHSFIVDGYRDGLFHVNWGWNGIGDGFFSLSNLNPGIQDGFNSNQMAITNVSPPASVSDSLRSKIILKSISCSDNRLVIDETNNLYPNFVISSTVCSDILTSSDIQIGYALYNDDGFIKLLNSGTFHVDPKESLSVELEVALDSNLINGNYRIFAVNRIGNSDIWLPDVNSESIYIEVRVVDSSIHLIALPNSSEECAIDFGVHTIQGITYHLMSEYGNNHAYLLPYNEVDNYSGSIFIPDYVDYHDMRFMLFAFNEDTAFINNDKVESISTSIPINIYNCLNLKTVEIRDGVVSTRKISDCPSLEKIVFSSSCHWIDVIENCKNLNTIIINNYYMTSVCPDSNGVLWSEKALPSLKDVFFYGAVPPVINNSAQNYANDNVKIHIPKGTREIYAVSEWSNWNLFEDGDVKPLSVSLDYCGNDMDSGFGFAFEHDYLKDINVEFAMRLPSEILLSYKNSKITAIEYYTPDKTINASNFDDIEYVFITNNEKDYIIKQRVTTTHGKWMRIDLSKIYEISGEDLYVGVGRRERLDMIWANLDEVEDGFWLRFMNDEYNYNSLGEWVKHGGVYDKNHPLPLRVIVEGENLPTDVQIVNVSLTDNSIQPDENIESGIQLKIRNKSPKVIKDFKIDWSFDEQEQTPIDLHGAFIPNFDYNVVVNLPKDLQGRRHVIDFNVSEVEGKADEVPYNSSLSYSYSVPATTYFPRKTVMEEACGTWCGYCPWGTVAIEITSSLYPDHFIPISIHNDNDMMVENGSYDSFLSSISNYPRAVINRTQEDDIHILTLNTEDTGEALINANASFAKDGSIIINTETIFGFNDKCDDSYRIAYVVVEDNVGPYYQTNYFSNPGEVADSNDWMYWWIGQPSYVLVTFNDVARCIYDYNGIDGLLPNIIEEGKKYESEYRINLPGNIQNYSNLKIVVLLIDPISGEILNADRTLISGEIPELTPKRGDSNGNGEINIADAINIANYVVGKYVETFVISASDVNEDGSISVSDASATVSIVLEQPAAIPAGGSCNSTNEAIESSEALIVDNYYINSLDNQNLSVSLENGDHYVAIQADITFPAGMLVDDIRLGMGVDASHSFISKRIDENTIRFVIFNFDNKPISTVDNKLLELSVIADEECSGDIRISNVIASDADAHEFSLSSKGGHNSLGLRMKETLGKEEIIKCANGAININNAYGQAVSISNADGRLISSFIPHSDFERVAVSSGIYIVTVGNRTLKVIVK